VAMSAYYLKQVVPQWSLGTIYKGMFDFMWIQCACILMVMFVPSISLWLPTTLTERATNQRMAPSSVEDAATENAQGKGSLEEEYGSETPKTDSLEKEYKSETPKEEKTETEERTTTK